MDTSAMQWMEKGVNELNARAKTFGTFAAAGIGLLFVRSMDASIPSGLQGWTLLLILAVMAFVIFAQFKLSALTWEFFDRMRGGHFDEANAIVTRMIRMGNWGSIALIWGFLMMGWHVLYP